MVHRISHIGAAAVVVGLGLGFVGVAPQPAIARTSVIAGVQLSATVLAMGGLGYEILEQDVIKRVLGGRYANEENLVGLPWPGEMAPFNGTLTLNQTVTVGLANMDAAIQSTPGPKIVAGASGSTLVVNEMMRRLGDDPTAPPKEEISFVVLGDADRGVLKPFRGTTLPIFDYTVSALPVTKYDVLVVAGEYDGLGDWPDRPWNLLAVINALAGTGLMQQVIPKEIVDALGLEGFGSVHYDAMFADLGQVPEKNITTTVNSLGGVTTTYLVPTPGLPMLRPLTTLGVPQDVVDSLEKGLRPIVDSGYARNDPFQALPGNASTRRLADVTPAVAAAVTPARTVNAPAPAAAEKAVEGPTGKRTLTGSRSNDRVADSNRRARSR